MVSLIEKSITSSSFCFFLCIFFKFALTLSNTTIVSFIEYHSMVKRAVTKNVSILNSGNIDEANIYSHEAMITS